VDELDVSGRPPWPVARIARWLVVLVASATIAGIVASPALAIYGHLNTTLSGPAINGVIPAGSATVDQSKLPTVPLTLSVQVSSVNLPDGTVLGAVVGDCGAAPVGRIKLSHGQGQLKTKVPGCQVGRQSAIDVNNNASTILSGGAPWQVG
jgi:hypothetical protein